MQIAILCDSGCGRTFYNNVGQYGTNTMVLHAIYSVLMVYAVCTVIDYLRMKHFGEMVYEAD